MVPAVSGDQMSQAMRFQEILRRLAVVEEGYADDQAGLVLGAPGVWGLDPRTAALVRAGVLAAIGAPEVCLEWSSSQALAADATEDQITGVLLAIAPVIGLGRMAAAAPGIAGAFGYDIEAALEDPDGT
jgi:4-carboxymuconolactone decarboxylase